MKSPLDKTRDAIRKKYPAFEYTVLDDTPVTPRESPWRSAPWPCSRREACT